MKSIQIVCAMLVLVVLVLVLSSAAAAQCGTYPRATFTVCGDSCGFMEGGFCRAGAPRTSFCFLGYGLCCQNEFTTANSGSDPSCGGAKITPFGSSKQYLAGLFHPGLFDVNSMRSSQPAFQFHRRALVPSACDGSLRANGVIVPTHNVGEAAKSNHDSVINGGGQ